MKIFHYFFYIKNLNYFYITHSIYIIKGDEICADSSRNNEEKFEYLCEYYLLVEYLDLLKCFQKSKQLSGTDAILK